MTDKPYENREIDSMFKDVHEKLDLIIRTNNLTLIQATKTNGRVSKLERNILVVSYVVGTILLLKFPQVIETIMKFI